MGLFVSTTGTDVTIKELGIVIVDPTVDKDMSQFSAEEIAAAASLTSSIVAGTLVWKKTSGGAVQTPADYDPDWVEAEELNTGSGLAGDQLAKKSDIGVNGASVQFSWKFSTSTTMADPGSKYFRYNSATPASITQIAISDITNGGGDVSNIISLLQLTNKIYLQQSDDATKYMLFEVAVLPIDNTTWWQIGVTPIDSGVSVPSNNAVCGTVLFASGVGFGPFTAGSVIFSGGGTVLSESNSSFFFDNTNKRLLLGQNANTNAFVLNTGTSGQTVLSAEDASTNLFGQVIGRSGTASNQGGQITFYRSRGTTAAKTAVLTNDNLGRILFTGHDGTDFARAARIDCIVTEVTPGAGAMGSKLSFSTTPAGTEAVVLAMEISSAQVATFVNSPAITPLTSGSVLYYSGTAIAQDNATFFWDTTNKRLGVGVGAASNVVTVNGIAFGSVTTIGADGTTDLMLTSLHRHSSTAGLGASFNFVRSRGASGAETTVSNGDLLGTIWANGHDGTDYANSSAIEFLVQGTVGANVMPGRINFKTSPAGSQTLASRISVMETIDITPTATASNMPYAFLIDHAATNLVPNSSWANNITDSWSAFGTSTNTRDTTEKWIGDASLKIVTSAANGGLISSAIAISSNTQYVLSVYIKGAVGGEKFSINLDPNVSATVSSANAFLGLGIADLVNTEWSRITLPWTSGASDTSVQIILKSEIATAQTVYIDAVQLEAKTWPVDSEEVVIASSYLDGSMGVGYAFTGTSHNSSSTRTAGTKHLAPLSATNGRGNFVVRTDGSVARMLFDAKEVQAGDFQGTRAEPNFPFTFTGNMKTNVLASGILSGIVNVRNNTNGIALGVESDATTSEVMVISGASVTSGTIMAIFAPSDLTAMDSAQGKFFSFAGKGAGLDMFTWRVSSVQMGAEGFNFEKNVNIYGGGSQSATLRAVAGTVGVTNGSANVTGTGFLTNFVRGQAIGINNGTALVYYTISSITSDTALVLTSNYAETTNAARAIGGLTAIYRPPVIHLEGSYGHHSTVTNKKGDFFYGIYASGGNGHLHVLKSSARGVAVTPTADNVGHGLVTTRFVDNADKTIFLSNAETNMVTGYTIPAYELRNATVFRIKFTASLSANATTTTTTWRIKLGGTTILTSTAHQAGSTFSGMTVKGEIEIVGITDSSQRVSMSVEGKDNGATGSYTFAFANYGTSSIDMRLDRTLSVTAQMSDALSALITTFSTIEIL